MPIPARAADVIATLKASGMEWTDEILPLLSIPEHILMLQTDSGTFYSADERFGILGIPAALGPGPLSCQKTDYGIALYSTGGNAYFILADLSRRIIVRERIFSIHDNPPEKDWNIVLEKIRAALSAAMDAKEDVVISDQGLRKVRLSV
jgi:hypothetical protein